MNEREKSMPKNYTFGIRTTSESKRALDKLADLLSESLGARVTLGQAFEVAVKEAVAARIGRGAQ